MTLQVFSYYDTIVGVVTHYDTMLLKSAAFREAEEAFKLSLKITSSALTFGAT